MPAPSRRTFLLGGAATLLATATGTGLALAHPEAPAAARGDALPFDLPANDSPRTRSARSSPTTYYEANNSENLRAGWTESIDGGADWVQLMTWNDFSEGTQVTPSVHNGWVWLDRSSYYLTAFKTGGYPKITRDTVYLSHRKQGHADRPGPAEQTSFQRLCPVSVAARDTVEALSFLTAPADVELTVGGEPHVYAAAAGG